MKRVLIVPAAGRGSRLSASLPKLLVPVGGRPMIDLVLDRYARVVDRAIVIVSPAAEPSVRKHFGGAELPAFARASAGSRRSASRGGGKFGRTAGYRRRRLLLLCLSALWRHRLQVRVNGVQFCVTQLAEDARHALGDGRAVRTDVFA